MLQAVLLYLALLLCRVRQEGHITYIEIIATLREEKQHKHRFAGSEFPSDIPGPYAWMPRGQTVSPHHQGCRKARFLMWTSTIFGADIHEPKGSRKTLSRRCLR